MKKKLLIFASIAVLSTLFVGCKSNLPAKDETKAPIKETTAQTQETTKTETTESVEETKQSEAPVAGGNYKTGLAIVTTADKSKDAGEEDGTAEVDNLMAAVIVDENGKIVNCYIDSAQAVMNFSAEGKLVTPADTTFATKNELGDAYGMKKASSIGKEWNEQAQAFADYVIGKTADEITGIAVTEGKAADADLASSVTVSIGGFQDVVVKAMKNATITGANAGDKLAIGTSVGMEKSKDATAEEEGLCQSDATFAAVTFDENGKITSCVIDGAQGGVNFDTAGKISTDLTMEFKTKNELGDDYGMKKASSIGKEWYEQAAAFAQYVTGKTVDEVKGIAVTEGKPSDADLSSSVTVSIGGFQAVIEKASGLAR